jgi:hypothetical protein
MLTASVNGSVSNFSLNVVGQGNPSASVPPSGNAQGVVAPSQSFALTVANASSSTGNYLFGFAGGTPQVCTTATNGQFSLTAPAQPGRYDILFDTTTQSCPVPAFPTSPAPTIIGSVDTIASPVTFEGNTVSGVSLTANASSTSPASNVLQIAYSTNSGTTIPVTVSVASSFDSNFSKDGCTGAGCLIQTEIGLNTDPAPQGCVANGGPGYSTTSGTITIQVPNLPGRYYVAMDRALNFSCLSPNAGWWSGPPSASRYIAIIDVTQ